MKQGDDATPATALADVGSFFARWAPVYDSQENPLLALEERHVAALLPSIDGGHVMDVGCGTGRWLTRFEASRPASLCGVDCSESMLQRARQKVQLTTKLIASDCTVLPCVDASCTLVVASFVLSYVADLQAFTRECARVLQPGGELLISDMHPTTANERGWKRGFKNAGKKNEVQTHSRSLAEILEGFRQTGFEVGAFIEPSFEKAEKNIFERAGKLAEFEELTGVPAIYILSLHKPVRIAVATSRAQDAPLALTNCRWSGGEDIWDDGPLHIAEGRIKNRESDPFQYERTIDLHGYCLLPGLINAHDHLEFGLFPRLGRAVGAKSYRNAVEWATEIHKLHAEVIERYRSIPRVTQLRWGAIRNLLCGVTTVCHHNPLYDDLKEAAFPVRVLSGYGWAHSLAFDGAVAERYNATPKDLPFLIHAAEGIDEPSRDEILQLDRLHVLDKQTVLIHGIACSASEIELINRRGASLVVCPTSNHFLFGEAHAREQLMAVERLALGSDSSITATGDLLDEVRYLRTEAGLEPNTIYRMVTTGAAEVLHLKDGRGRIEELGIADLIAVRESCETPAATLANLTMRSVELVILAGRVQLASAQIYERLPDDLRAGMELIEVEDLQRWIRYPMRELLDSARALLGIEDIKLAGKKVRYAGTL